MTHAIRTGETRRILEESQSILSSIAARFGLGEGRAVRPSQSVVRELSPLRARPAQGGSTTTATRKKSSLEVRRRKRLRTNGPTLSLPSLTVAPEADPLSHKSTKRCGLCQAQGHQMPRCSIIKKYGSLLTDRQLRADLARDIHEQGSFQTTTLVGTPSDMSVVMQNIPRNHVSCAIIHERLVQQPDPLLQNARPQTLLKCTFLGPGGVLKEGYTQELFTADAMASYITGSKKLICQLVPSSRPTTTALVQVSPSVEEIGAAGYSAVLASVQQDISH